MRLRLKRLWWWLTGRCVHCWGTGKVELLDPVQMMGTVAAVRCPSCAGTGRRRDAQRIMDASFVDLLALAHYRAGDARMGLDDMKQIRRMIGRARQVSTVNVTLGAVLESMASEDPAEPHGGEGWKAALDRNAALPSDEAQSYKAGEALRTRAQGGLDLQDLATAAKEDGA